jgi:hypothetical protein
MVSVVAVPEPTAMLIEPVSVSLALVIPSSVLLEAVALLLPEHSRPPSRLRSVSSCWR